MASGKATIKSIISGDTVVLVGNATNGPPPELMLTLSGIQAPKFTRNLDQQSEPFAYESREFLRKLLIGKPVTFKVEYKVASINRDFGTILFNNENVAKIILREGWAKLKSMKESNVSNDSGNKTTTTNLDYEEFQQLSEEAISLNKGIYAKVEPQKSIKYGGFDMQAVYEQHKGNTLRGIVEMIRDGSSMKILLVKNLCVVNVILTGTQCPRLNFTSTNKEEETSQPQPYAKEAKFYTESHLLQREVDITMEGTDKFGNIYASVIHHPSGNDISVALIKNGLAKTNDWSINYASIAKRALLRNAERSAKQNKLRIWKNYTPPKIEGDKNFQGKIIEVVSGDCVIVLSTNSHIERRVYLSSIRAPRVRKDDSDPYGFESKEFLRKKSIGKTVNVNIDYEKDPPAGATGPAAQKRSYGTVTFVDKANKTVDLGLSIIKEGLAEVMHHRQDEERAANYGEYTDAQEVAVKQKKGLHSGKAAPLRRYNDVSSDSTKAKQFLPFLKRENSLKAVVEQVFSGSKLKVYIPKENCMLTYIIAGVKCPATARQGIPGSTSEPFAEEAKSFTRENLMQRDVSIIVEDMDRGGSAFGPVLLANGKNFACLLLEEGLATIDSYSIERTRRATELQNAEGLARQNKRGIWLSASTTPKASSTGNEPTLQTADNVERVRLSEIFNVNNFYIHKLSSKDLPIIESKLMEFTKEHGQRGTPIDIKKGVNCYALFDDEQGPVWNRAKIEAVDQNGNVRVRFVDYGNVATLPSKKISGVDPALNNYPPQSHECTLAFIKPQSLDEEFGTDAALQLREVAWDRNLLARIHGKDEQNRLIVSLYENEKNLAEILLEKGLVRVDRRSIKTCATYQKDIGKRYIEIQEKAKRDRLHIWRYGDIESDDEDSGFPSWGKRQ